MITNRFTRVEDVPDAPTEEDLTDLERLVLAHRHLYYGGKGEVICDYFYDLLERRAVKLLPKTSAVHDVGSYSGRQDVIELANQMLSQ